MQQAGKYIIITGIILIIAGIIFWLWGNKLGFLGKLPGDIHIKKENFTFYFPITTLLLLSLLVNVILWLIRKFM